MQAIETLHQIRRRIIRSVDGITNEELLWIPPGFRNNILWNLGHIAVTQQLLHYHRTGQPMRVAEEIVELFRSGSSPADWSETPRLELVLRLLEELPPTLQRDYRSGRLSTYNPFTTGAGIHIADIDTAISFNNYHEGIHTGVILCMRRLWSREVRSGAETDAGIPQVDRT
jgi:hypothetical protein